MTDKNDLRRTVKAMVVPFLSREGFSAAGRADSLFMTFHRLRGETVHLLEFQWDKYDKSRFVVNYGSCPTAGLAADGTVLPPEEVAAGWCPDYGRLKPRRGATTRAWFRQDVSLLRRLTTGQRLRREEDVAAEVLELLPEVLRYWKSGEVGSHMSRFLRDAHSRRR